MDSAAIEEVACVLTLMFISLVPYAHVMCALTSRLEPPTAASKIGIIAGQVWSMDGGGSDGTINLFIGSKSLGGISDNIIADVPIQSWTM